MYHFSNLSPLPFLERLSSSHREGPLSEAPLTNVPFLYNNIYCVKVSTSQEVSGLVFQILDQFRSGLFVCVAMTKLSIHT